MNERADFQQQQAGDERLRKTLDTLDAMKAAGMKESAEFLARELGVFYYWQPKGRQWQESAK